MDVPWKLTMVIYHIPGIFEKCEKPQKAATAGSCPSTWVVDVLFCFMLFSYMVNFGSETWKKKTL